LQLLGFFIFFITSTTRTRGPIWKVDGSNDAIWCKEVPFGGRVATKFHSGFEIAKKPKFTPDRLLYSQIKNLEELFNGK
jgi:hypothetical protein